MKKLALFLALIVAIVTNATAQQSVTLSNGVTYPSNQILGRYKIIVNGQVLQFDSVSAGTMYQTEQALLAQQAAANNQQPAGGTQKTICVDENGNQIPCPEDTKKKFLQTTVGKALVIGGAVYIIHKLVNNQWQSTGQQFYQDGLGRYFYVGQNNQRVYVNNPQVQQNGGAGILGGLIRLLFGSRNNNFATNTILPGGCTGPSGNNFCSFHNRTNCGGMQNNCNQYNCNNGGHNHSGDNHNHSNICQICYKSPCAGHIYQQSSNTGTSPCGRCGNFGCRNH